MKLLRSIIANEDEFNSKTSNSILDTLNKKEKDAYRIISENKDLSDPALSRKLSTTLYECPPSHSTYKSFKDGFTHKLERIILNHQSKGSPLQKIAFELQDDICILMKMTYMGLREAIYNKFKKTLKKAMKYHHYEAARSVSLMLVNHYTLYGAKNEIEKAQEQFESINIICIQEKNVKQIYSDIIKETNLTDDAKEIYQKAINDIVWRLEYDSYTYHAYYYSILLLISKEDEYISICQDAIEYFENLWFDHSAYVSIFRNKLLQKQINNGDYVKSKLILNLLMQDHRPTSYHWYVYSLTYVKVLLYAQEYNAAYEWYHAVYDSRNYRTQPKDHRNEWEVLGMYIHLLTDKLDNIKIHKIKYNLDYGQTDRSSTNVPFLIGEIFYQMKNGQLEIAKKVNNLEKVADNDTRVLALCNALRSGSKYKVEATPIFEKEIVPHESLIRIL